MPEPRNPEPQKSLEMRVAELEDKLSKLHITEEEMQAYRKVSSLLGSPMAMGAPMAAGAQPAAAPAPVAGPAGGCIVASCIWRCIIWRCVIFRCNIIRPECWECIQGGTIGGIGGGFESFGM